MSIVPDFPPNQDNVRRLAMLKYVENVPAIFHIIWQCDTAPDGATGGRSRFFSYCRETDVEHQKVPFIV